EVFGAKTAENLCLGFGCREGKEFCKGLNRYLSKTRYVVEQSFGTLHRKFRYARAAYFGLIKVSAQSHLKAMCLNLLKAANRLSAPAAA
ncbi:transposase, partial [Neisseria meningitidis]|uniref:transposase n=2 Tax=Neisseria meningitidis TaxID=487 RepID=UPI001EFCFE54